MVIVFQQTVAHLGWESKAVYVVRAHLDVVIPLTILAVKILVQISAREETMEVVRSVSSIPLELMLIAMSFMLAALSGISTSYLTKFPDQNSADLYAAISLVVMFVICLFISRLTKLARILGQKLSVAVKQYRELSAQLTIPETRPDARIVGRILWAIVYCMTMALVLSLNFTVSFVALGYILHLIQ